MISLIFNNFSIIFLIFDYFSNIVFNYFSIISLVFNHF